MNATHIPHLFLPLGSARSVRGLLHDEFQPGLKFQAAHRAEILLRLQDEFQLGLKFEVAGKIEEKIKTGDLWKWARASLAI